jgi:SAM-dependent methyltransferase
MKNFWDERYSAKEFIYGIKPNDFFKEQLEKMKPGKILLPGEGEGRNAVHAAKYGWDVDAIDWSHTAKEKALKLAQENNVLINYTVKDLTEFQPEEETYDAAALIFVSFEEELRQVIHKKVTASLKPGGKLILEAYEKDQIKNSSGGPKDINMLYSLEDITGDFIDMEFEYFAKEQIYLEESKIHHGEADVIRFVGIKSHRDG